ncbi:hypothetical protein WBP07_29395 [Novosphingobium sp. BL-8A]|uniref:hypothetical protein n=1 Tax=Novosphingobium sp. BL-8A TaxID=3127639 RepID=UPI0037573CD8
MNSRFLRVATGLSSRYHHDAFVYPATTARVGGDLMVACSQFNRRDAGQATTAFELLRIPFAAIARGN